MRAFLWVSVVAAGSVVAYLAIGYVVAARLSAPVRQPVERTPADVGLDYREVGLRSSDGLSLGAWWVGKAGSSRAAALVPGWGGGQRGAPPAAEVARNTSAHPTLSEAVKEAVEGIAGHMINL